MVYFSLSWLDAGQWQDDPPIPCSPVRPLPGGFFPEGETVYQTGEEHLTCLFSLIRERMARDIGAVAYLSHSGGTHGSPRIWNMDEGFPSALNPGDRLVLAPLGRTLHGVDRWVKAGGARFFFLSLCMVGDRPTLRFLCPYTPPELPAGVEEQNLTLRQRERIQAEVDAHSPFSLLPYRLNVDGREFELGGCWTSYSCAAKSDRYLRLLLDYLRQEGRLPDGLPEDGLMMADRRWYPQEDEPPFPEPPYRSLRMPFPETRRETLLELPFTARLGEQDDAYVWRDADGGEHTLYVEGLHLDDPYEEEAEHAGEPRYDNYFRALEERLPRGRRLLKLAYECSSDVEGFFLSFKRRAELDQVPEPPAGNGVIGWICGPNREFGPHGNPLRIHVLGPVPPDFSGPVELELFSVSRELPPRQDWILL